MSYVHSIVKLSVLNHNYFYEGFHFHHVFWLIRKKFLLFCYHNIFIFILSFQTLLKIKFVRSTVDLLEIRVSDWSAPVENDLMIDNENYVRNYLQIIYFGRNLGRYLFILLVVSLIRLVIGSLSFSLKIHLMDIGLIKNFVS